MDQNLELNISLKTRDEIDKAVDHFCSVIKNSAHLSTPTTQPRRGQNVFISMEIRQLIRERRRLRRIWQQSRNPLDKTNFNRASNHLKKRITELRNDEVTAFLKGLDTSKDTDYSLYKATRYLKHPVKRNVPVMKTDGTWCRNSKSKAEAFSEYLHQIYQPFPTTHTLHENNIYSFLESPYQMDFPMKPISPREVQNAISKLNNKKSPGHDKIDSIVAKSLSKKGIIFLTLIYNSIMRLSYFPTSWKRAEVIMIQKPNKPENQISSYRPISLLTTFSKIFEKLFVTRLLPILEKESIIPDHQFGFRQRHGTPEQCHRIVKVISDSLERKMYCSAAFLDIKQAFDRVWHEGLLFKLKKILPAPHFSLLNSYICNRTFYVKVDDETSNVYQIFSGVPQGSVLGPILYTIYTSDMPTSDNVEVATYADDTAIISTNKCHIEASCVMQRELNALQQWLNKWKITINVEKCNHVTFTLRKEECPPVYINNLQLPISSCVKYLGMYLDKRLTWKEHIINKRKFLNIKTRKMNWLLGTKSQLSLENKIKLYKVILKPVWTYGIQLWGTTSTSNIEILQRYQSKTLRNISGAPWFMTNIQIHRDLKVPFILNEINRFSSRYVNRLSNHQNPLAISLLDETNEIRRLNRFHVLDLQYRK